MKMMVAPHRRRLLSVVHQVSPNLCAGVPADFDQKHVEATGFLLDETRELDMQKIAGKGCAVDATGFLLDTVGDLHLGTTSLVAENVEPWEDIDDFTQQEEVEQRIASSAAAQQLFPGGLIYAMSLDIEKSANADDMTGANQHRSAFEAFLRRSKLEECSAVEFVGGKIQLVSDKELHYVGLGPDGSWAEAMMRHTRTPNPAEVQRFIREQQDSGGVVAAAFRLQLLSNGDALVSPMQDLQRQHAGGLSWTFLRVQLGAEAPEWWSSLLDRSNSTSGPLLIPAIQEEEEEEKLSSSGTTSTSSLQAWMTRLMGHNGPVSRIGFIDSDGIPNATPEELEDLYHRDAEERNNVAIRTQEVEEQETQAQTTTGTTTITIAPDVGAGKKKGAKGVIGNLFAAAGRNMDGVPTVEDLQSLLRHVQERDAADADARMHDEVEWKATTTAATAASSPTTPVPAYLAWLFCHMDRVPTAEELRRLVLRHAEGRQKELENSRAVREATSASQAAALLALREVAQVLPSSAPWWQAVPQVTSASQAATLLALQEVAQVLPRLRRPKF